MEVQVQQQQTPLKINNPAPSVEQINADRITQVNIVFDTLTHLIYKYNTNTTSKKSKILLFTFFS